jgi:hypothetical protein
MKHSGCVIAGAAALLLAVTSGTQAASDRIIGEEENGVPARHAPLIFASRPVWFASSTRLAGFNKKTAGDGALALRCRMIS